jgi:hypothetical protein
VRVGTVGGLLIRENVSLIRDRPCALSILVRGLFGVSMRSEGVRSGGRDIDDPEPEEWLRECFEGDIFCG